GIVGKRTRSALRRRPAQHALHVALAVQHMQRQDLVVEAVRILAAAVMQLADGIDAVAGLDATPFVRAVIVAEATSLVSNLGTKGIGYINGDLTVALSRLPIGEFVGVQGDSHWCADGISVGSATLFDDRGPFGTGLVTAIANPAAQIDFGSADAMPTLRV
ncbi:MAG TPA: hypothetical protein PLL04_03285, partial [Thauera sp.]|nr:hypothetical protein [Thauera sp.]